MKDGFTADLIEVNAIVGLQTIYGGAFTLVRQRCSAPFNVRSFGSPTMVPLKK